MGKIETAHNVNDHWCTPQEIWQPLIDEWGSIGLDPFSNPHSLIPARMRWSIWPRPLKNHKGVMRFSDTGTGGSRLDYTIEFEGKLPLIGPIIKAGLDQGIRRGLNKLKL